MVFNLRTPKPVPVVLPASGEADDEVEEQREDTNTMLFRAAQTAFEKLRPYKNTGDRADHAIFNELVDERIDEDLGVTTQSDLLEPKQLIRALRDALLYADHHHDKLHVPCHFAKYAKRRKLTPGKTRPPQLSEAAVSDRAV